VTAPRLEIDLDAIGHNASVLVGRLAPRDIGVTAVTKAVMGAPQVVQAVLDAGARGIGDSRIATLGEVRDRGTTAPLTLIRSPMPSEVDRVVVAADVSLNTEPAVLVLLSAAAVAARTTHAVVLMVELGDLREGLMPEDLEAVVRLVLGLPGLELAGIGTNLACRSGVVPDATNMGVLDELVARTEALTGTALRIVSGGNSASLGWALTADDTGRVDDLRLGEAILLGVDPLDRSPIDGLRTDAITLVAEVIESRTKPARPWGQVARSAFGAVEAATGRGPVAQTILAIGRQDTDPAGLEAPGGTTILGASSDHLVVATPTVVPIGAELRFRPDYSALLRGTTSPFVATRFLRRTTSMQRTTGA
jgi:ornithine racemase